MRLRLQVGPTVILADLFNERQMQLPNDGETVTVNFPYHAGWVLEQRD